MPSVPNATWPPRSRMSRVRAMPGAQPEVRSRVVHRHRARVGQDLDVLIARPDEVGARHVGAKDAEIGEAPHRGLAVGAEVEQHLRARLQDMRGDPRGALRGQPPAQVQLIRAGWRPVRCQDDADPVVVVVPLGVHAPIGIKYGVGRPCVAHGRVPHPGREVGGQRRQEGVVVPVHVDVLIAGDHAQGHPHADCPIGLQDGLVAEVGQGRHPVAEVDDAGLAAPDGIDRADQDDGPEVVLRDRVAGRPGVRALEHELEHPRRLRGGRVEMAVDEAGHDEVIPRSEDPVERPEAFEFLPVAQRGDGLALDDQSAIAEDGRAIGQRNERIAEDKVARHR